VNALRIEELMDKDWRAVSYCAAPIVLFGVAASIGCADYANMPDHGCSQAVLSSACYRIWAANDQRAAAANPDPIFLVYVGKDVHALFAKIGYPDSQREIAGDSVFTWSLESDSDVELPTTTTTTGNLLRGTSYAHRVRQSQGRLSATCRRYLGPAAQVPHALGGVHPGV